MAGPPKVRFVAAGGPPVYAPAPNPLPALGPVEQQVIGEHAGHHGLADGHGADAEAGIVAAPGRNLGVLAGGIKGGTDL